VVAADGVLDRPGDAVGTDRDQAKLIRDAEHHDVDVLLGTQALFAELGEVLGVGMFFTAVGEDFILQLLGLEVGLAQQRVNRRLLVQVDHRAGAFPGGDAELLARVDGADAFEDVDGEQKTARP